MSRHAALHTKEHIKVWPCGTYDPFGSTALHDCGGKVLEFRVDDVRTVERVGMILYHRDEHSAVETP